MSIFAIVALILTICIFIYLYYEYAGDAIKRRRTIFEIKMLWMGTKGNYEDAIMKQFNVGTQPYKQAQKICVLTGGNKGIGLGVLKKLLECEMTVVLAVRNPKEARESVEKNIDASLIQNRVSYEVCDMFDIETVKRFAEVVHQKHPRINLLINNAGILPAPYKVTKEGYISQMAINYLGHFMLTHLLMPNLRAGAEAIGVKSRVVSVASNVHEVGLINYNDFHCKNYYRASMAYANSKLAQIMFAYELERLCRRENWDIQSFAPHPGVVDTDIFQKSLVNHIPGWKRFLFKTVEEGARTIVYAAIEPELEGKGGAYLTNCLIKAPVNDIAHDDKECEKLFKYTCNMLNIQNFGKENFNNNEE
ncbi:polyprenol dehydrogenase-like [Chironomus tepperi]|uniref:polyprenol dehydrogenase-like n=1 Tax=Chironomus tepperi TaxID=113505 RepID=UPI00391FB269